MEPNFQVERQIFKFVVRTAGVLVILVLITMKMNLILGYLFGLVISALMLLHSLSTAKRALGQTEKSIKGFMMRRYVLHYIINGATLAAAYKSPHLSMVGAVVGLLTVKAGLLIWAFWHNIAYFFQSGLKRFR